MFSVINFTVAAHLQLLARLSLALGDPGFRASAGDEAPRGYLAGSATGRVIGTSVRRELPASRLSSFPSFYSGWSG
jgi:hypothetical protein